MTMSRIYERQTDALFARAFRENPAFSARFLTEIGGTSGLGISDLSGQVRHLGPGNRGSIDLQVTLSNATILLIENKIDAGYSVTSTGEAQPDRYRASVAALRAQGKSAASVLLAPEIYLAGSRHKDAFDHRVSYESLHPTLRGAERALLDAAIAQAAAPYDPVADISAGAFHADLEAFAAADFPELAIKRNPNGNGVRPGGSRTIYFDVPRMLKIWPHLPRPRMSLQCRDFAAPSASVKIMLGGMGHKAGEITPPHLLAEIGGYVRPAGRSLGLVVDTPKLDNQRPLAEQVSQARRALEAARKLAAWWNGHAQELRI